MYASVSALLGALGVLVVLGGCDSLSGTDEATDFAVEMTSETLNTGGVSIEEIDRGQYGDIVDGTREVLRDEQAYAALWERLHADGGSVPDRPTVDFDTQIVIAVVLGQRPNGGYSVAVDEVLTTESGTPIQVRFTERIPGDGCAVTQALTSPYVLATVETDGGEVTFEGREETRPC